MTSHDSHEPRVKLIALTQPRVPEIHDADELVAYVARVSNPDNQLNNETAPRLLDYLQRNAHWSPFEHVSATLEFNTTLDIATQVLRHRSFVFQQFSGRYAEMSGEPHLREARMQDTKNRQNSLPCTDPTVALTWEQGQRRVWEIALEVYKNALASGVAKEVARAVLPVGNTRTRLYVTGNIRSWIHYCQLRTDPGTQKEHRELAQEASHILATELPYMQEFFK